MTESDSQALHKIETHEAVCSERYGQIHESLEAIRKEISHLRADMKASDAAIEARVETNEKSITGINLKIAYFLGASTVGSILGGAIIQLLSGALAK